LERPHPGDGTAVAGASESAAKEWAMKVETNVKAGRKAGGTPKE